jgi:hypothetical protein
MNNQVSDTGSAESLVTVVIVCKLDDLIIFTSGFSLRPLIFCCVLD